MTRVEGENSRLGHYLARLHRKTFCYSKSVDMLRYSMRLLIHYLHAPSVLFSSWFNLILQRRMGGTSSPILTDSGLLDFIPLPLTVYLVHFKIGLNAVANQHQSGQLVLVLVLLNQFQWYKLNRFGWLRFGLQNFERIEVFSEPPHLHDSKS